MLLGQNVCWNPPGSGTKEQENNKITSFFASMNKMLSPSHLHHLHEAKHFLVTAILNEEIVSFRSS